MQSLPNLLLILTGKTASGKDTVMQQLLLRFPSLKRVLTTTSRAPRNGETEGKDYHFISRQEFLQKINEGDFVEYVEYAGNLYGTEKKKLTNNLGNGLIWRIDPSRSGQIREFISSSFGQEIAKDLLKRILVIYLTVDDQVILQRLKKRGLDPEATNKRMQEDAKFWQEYKQTYDYVIENVPGKLDETVNKIANIIENRTP